MGRVVRDMSHACLSHDVLMCVTGLVHMCDSCPTLSYMSLVCMCGMTFFFEQVKRDAFRCVTKWVFACDMMHSYVWHDSVICVTWLVHTGVQHVAFTCATSRIHTAPKTFWWWGLNPGTRLLFDLHHELGTKRYLGFAPIMSQLGSISAGFQSTNFYIWCVPRIFRAACDMTHSQWGRDSLTCVTWRILIYMCVQAWRSGNDGWWR